MQGTKQQLYLKASQETKLRTLLELSAVNSTGKHYVKQKETYTLGTKNSSLPHTEEVWGLQTIHGILKKYIYIFTPKYYEPALGRSW